MICKSCNEREIVTNCFEKYACPLHIPLRQEVGEQSYNLLTICLQFPKEAPMCKQCQLETVDDLTREILGASSNYKTIKQLGIRERVVKVFDCVCDKDKLLLLPKEKENAKDND